MDPEIDLLNTDPIESRRKSVELIERTCASYEPSDFKDLKEMAEGLMLLISLHDIPVFQSPPANQQRLRGLVVIWVAREIERLNHENSIPKPPPR